MERRVIWPKFANLRVDFNLHSGQTYVLVNNHRLLMEVHTGASVYIVSEEILANTFYDCHLQPAPNITLQTYKQQPLSILGQLHVSVQVDNNPTVTLPLIAVKGQGPSLLGCNWLHKIKLDWKGILHVTELDPQIDDLT